MVSKRHLYDLLGVDPGATDDEIARAYRQLALKYHPDRNPEGTAKFTEMANAYCVLGDPEKRRVYNATGIAPGAEEQETNSEAASAQRAAELQERVQTFYTAYTGSQEEVDDVISIYNKCKGNFRRMVREELLFDNGKSGEIQRLQELVRNLVDTGKVKVTEAWNATNSMKVLKQIERSLKKERTEAASALKEMGLAGGNENGDNMHALQALVKRQSGEEWSNMLSNLTERYVTKKKQVGTEQGGVGRKRKREPVEAIATPRQGRNKKK